MKKLGYLQYIRIALLVLIVLTLGFIFFQSTLPPEKSMENSEAVGGVLGEIIPPDTPTGEFVQENVRKIAHFVEFMVLGIWTALYLALGSINLKYFSFSFAFALFAALLDETIQLFSERGPSVTDIWLDFAGFCASAVIIYTGCYIYSVIRSKKQTKVDKNGVI